MSEPGAMVVAPHAPMSILSLDQIELLKRTICKGSTNDELALFVNTSKRLGLDPFARQIFAVKRNTWNADTRQREPVMSIQVSIDGFRLVAERAGDYAGQIGPLWCGEDGVWIDVWLKTAHPAAAKVGVLRRSFSEPLWAVARWESYKQSYEKGGQEVLSPMWVKMGDLMLAKCAEALALRRAFPQHLSGVYTSDEMGQADRVEPVEADDPPPKPDEESVLVGELERVTTREALTALRSRVAAVWKTSERVRKASDTATSRLAKADPFAVIDNAPPPTGGAEQVKSAAGDAGTTGPARPTFQAGSNEDALDREVAGLIRWLGHVKSKAEMQKLVKRFGALPHDEQQVVLPHVEQAALKLEFAWRGPDKSGDLPQNVGAREPGEDG